MNLEMIGNLLQTAGSVALLYSYIPQVIQLIKTKKSDDLSTQFWIIITFGLACITGNMAIAGVPLFILATQFGNTILAAITLALVLKYKRKG